MLKTRVAFGLLMIAGVGAVLVADPYLGGGTFPCLAVVAAVVMWLAAGELQALLANLPLALDPWWCRLAATALVLGNWLPALLPASAGWLTAGPLPVGVGLFVPAGLLAFLTVAAGYRQPGDAVAKVAGYLLVLFYLGVLGSFVVQTRWLGTAGQGAVALCLTIFVPKMCDTGAYFTGKSLGRHKVTPVLSPGKTWEGCIGGLVVAVLVCLGIVAAGAALTGTAVWPYPQAAAFGLAIGLAAQVGDLMESLIKRDCQRKDASHNIPGFGGLLDVIDSILFAAPLSWWLLATFGRFG